MSENSINIISELLSKKTIIAFAESTHGTKEFSTIRYSIIKKMIENHNVRFIGLEEDFGDVFFFNQYINDITVNLDEYVSFLSLPYHNQEFINFIEWLKQYNTINSKHRVTLFGYDMQFNQQSARVVLDILESFDSKLHVTYKSMLTELANNHYTNYVKTIDKTSRERILNDLKSLKKEFENTEHFSKKDWLSLNLGINVLIQKVEAKNSGTQNDQRDYYMMQNIKSVVDQTKNYPLAIISHSRHAQKIPTKFFKTLGTYLNKEYQEDYFVLGFEFGIGSVRAIKTRENSSGIYNIKKIKDSFSRIMNKSPFSQYYLDLDKVHDNSALNENINKTHLFKDIGGYLEQFLLSYNPLEIYDAVIFTKEGNATEKINNKS